MLLVIVIVVVVHLNHQTTEVCPTDVPRPVGPASPEQPPARWSATAQAAWTDGWHPAVDKNQKRQLPSSPSSALWLQVFTTVYGMIIGASEEAPIMIYRGRSFRPLCGQVTKRDKWPGICAKCFIYYYSTSLNFLFSHKVHTNLNCSHKKKFSWHLQILAKV